MSTLPLTVASKIIRLLRPLSDEQRQMVQKDFEALMRRAQLKTIINDKKRQTIEELR
jgi:hypothetical protein